MKSLLTVNQVKKDDIRKLLVLHCEMAGTDLVIFNIYAPPNDLTQEQNIFLNSLRKFVEGYCAGTLFLWEILIYARLDKM